MITNDKKGTFPLFLMDKDVLTPVLAARDMLDEQTPPSRIAEETIQDTAYVLVGLSEPDIIVLVEADAGQPGHVSWGFQQWKAAPLDRRHS